MAAVRRRSERKGHRSDAGTRFLDLYHHPHSHQVISLRLQHVIPVNIGLCRAGLGSEALQRKSSFAEYQPELSLFDSTCPKIKLFTYGAHHPFGEVFHKLAGLV